MATLLTVGFVVERTDDTGATLTVKRERPLLVMTFESFFDKHVRSWAASPSLPASPSPALALASPMLAPALGTIPISPVKHGEPLMCDPSGENTDAEDTYFILSIQALYRLGMHAEFDTRVVRIDTVLRKKRLGY